MQRSQISSLGWEDLLEKEMATNFSILAWGIPWTEKPGGLQSIGSHRKQHEEDYLGIPLRWLALSTSLRFFKKMFSLSLSDLFLSGLLFLKRHLES